jgi:hypothetical protein
MLRCATPMFVMFALIPQARGTEDIFDVSSLTTDTPVDRRNVEETRRTSLRAEYPRVASLEKGARGG